ncbi:hypothetical protein [Aquabacter cavernae]|uniref:arsenate reductase/protein-tyrosine-phosphatase family protein n=1 Tax=Aquabacter cavernae TaxID=2496029 RepID=UPI000F8D01F6|nr:hypothetical protein [Aquabacter cavernae]
MRRSPIRPRAAILFACRDNGGLSLLAEALAHGRTPHLRAFSAGVQPGPVDLAAVECLHSARIPVDGLSAKPLEVFSLPGAPRIDVVVSLVEGIEAEMESFARRVRCIAHQRWRLDDAAALADPHARRLAYRRLLPNLVSAISELGRTHAFAA